MTDIRNDTLRRAVLIVFLVPAAVISIAIWMVETLVESVQEIPGAVRIVWQKQ